MRETREHEADRDRCGETGQSGGGFPPAGIEPAGVKRADDVNDGYKKPSSLILNVTPARVPVGCQKDAPGDSRIAAEEAISRSKHTPGPWTATPSESWEGRWLIVQPIEPHTLVTAVAQTYQVSVPEGQEEANARLIAAAPELLRERDGLNETVESASKCIEEREQTIDELRAALEKIRDLDYRGNEHISASIAREALK
jgi:hypothetical protein